MLLLYQLVMSYLYPRRLEVHTSGYISVATIKDSSMYFFFFFLKHTGNRGLRLILATTSYSKQC